MTGYRLMFTLHIQALINLNFKQNEIIYFQDYSWCILIIHTIYFCPESFKNQFKVKGNCEMCKERIENTAKKAGAKKATYSIDLQILTIETDSNASSDEI
jgi:hypothetical protein